MRLRARFGQREFSASPWFLLLTLAGVALFVQLGRWQWHRAEFKRALAAQFVQGTAPPTPLGERSLAQLQRYARLYVEGQYDGAHQFLLDNLSRDGRAGYEVLTPFRLTDGRVALVNRGWLPASGDRRQLPDISLPPPAAGSTRLAVRYDHLPVTGLAMGRAAPPPGPQWPKLTSFPTSTELATTLGAALEDGQLLLEADDPAGYRRDWQPASSSFPPERHQAYAIQWWGLAALAAVLFVVVNLRKRPV